MNKKDKFFGGIIGMIIGDILAFPLKSLNYNSRKELFPIKQLIEPFNINEIIEQSENNEYKLTELKNKISTWYPAGFYSFYSQQALLVLDSLFQIKDFDIEDISQRLVKYSFPRDRIAPLGIFRGYSRSFYDAIQNICNGLPLKVCGVTNCNGDSPFKSIPLALFYNNNLKLLREKSIDLTLLTNRSIQAIAASAAIAYTISQTSSKSYFNVDNDIASIINFTRETEDYAMKRFSDFIPANSNDINTLSKALNELNNVKNESLENGIEKLSEYIKHNNHYQDSPVTITLQSLLIFIKNIGNFENTINSTLELNVNTEIITPIVGAISGSLLGTEKIPKYYRELIKDSSDILIKIENLQQKEDLLDEKKVKLPKFKNYYTKEIELSGEQGQLKEDSLKKIQEKLELHIANPS